MKILIVEDDELMRKMIKTTLESEDYVVVETGDPVEGFDLLKTEEIDFVILDWGLPKINGVNMCKIIRNYPQKYGNPYITLLTAKTGEDNIVQGLEAGADDYIKKPFSGKELIARIKAIKRTSEKPIEKIITYNNICLDTEKATVLNTETAEYIEIPLPEFEILKYMVLNKGDTLTRENISMEVFKREYEPGNRLIDNYVSRLKTRIAILDGKIRTVRSMGYKLLS